MSNLNTERNHHAARRRIAGAAGRIAEKQRKAAQAAAVQQALATIDPAYLEKLKHDCLRAANERLRGASPEEVVREAARDLEGRLRFLTEKQTAPLHKLSIDDDEYKAEIERRRQIGLTIDPGTAETMFRHADLAGPYCILDRKYCAGTTMREPFARSPGGDTWVRFNDLPDASRNALWERDQCKLSFPYGLNLDHDVINYPPQFPKRS